MSNGLLNNVLPWFDHTMVPKGINPGIILLNGDVHDAKEPLTLANLALLHTLHYGVSAFEGTRAYPAPDGRGVFLLAADLHNQRLHNSLGYLQVDSPPPSDLEMRIIEEKAGKRWDSIKDAFEAPLDAAEIEAAKYNRQVYDLTSSNIRLLQEEARRGKITAQGGGYIRTVVINSLRRGKNELGVLSAYHLPLEIMLVWEWGKYLGTNGFEKGISVRIDEERKILGNDDPKHKLASNYERNQRAKNRARAMRFNEALFLDNKDNVLEGGGENILIQLKDGTLVTPNRQNQPILDGITIQIVEQIARNLGYDVVNSRKISYETLFKDAVGAVFTGTACEVTPIRLIYDPKEQRFVEYKVTPILRKIQQEYMDLVQGKEVDPRNRLLQKILLTYVSLNCK